MVRLMETRDSRVDGFSPDSLVVTIRPIDELIKDVSSPRILMLITGPACVGKDSVIYGGCFNDQEVFGLADLLDAHVVDKDEIRKDKGAMPGDADYQLFLRDSVYETVFAETNSALRLEEPVIINAAFRHQIGKEGWEIPYRELAKQYGVNFKLVRITASIELIRQRMIDRNSPFDLDKPKSSDEELANWYDQNEPIQVPMPKDALVVRNNGNLPDLIQQIFTYATTS